MRTIEREIVAAHLYSSDGKLFMAIDGPTISSVYPGCWKIVGGGVEEGESRRDALRREILEETGLDVSPYVMELVDDTMTGESEKTLKKTGEKVLVKMKFYSYKVVLDKPAEQIVINLDPQEFAEYRWVSIPELKSLKLSPPSIEIFTKLGYL